jgi:hypothetical protein
MAAFDDKKKTSTSGTGLKSSQALTRALESANQNISSAANAAVSSAARLASIIATSKSATKADERSHAISHAAHPEEGHHVRNTLRKRRTSDHLWLVKAHKKEMGRLRSLVGQLLAPMNNMEACAMYASRLEQVLEQAIASSFPPGKDLDQVCMTPDYEYDVFLRL